MNKQVKSILLSVVGGLLGLAVDYITNLRMEDAVEEAVEEAVEKRFALLEAPEEEEDADEE